VNLGIVVGDSEHSSLPPKKLGGTFGAMDYKFCSGDRQMLGQETSDIYIFAQQTIARIPFFAWSKGDVFVLA